jgi:predicted MPP superfamily phosphohydrolase
MVAASMRTSFLVFFALVFAGYFAIQIFLFVRGWQALAWRPRWRGWYAAVFWFAALAFLAGRNLENLAVTPWSTALVWIGAFWFALMYYLLLLGLVVEITGRLLRRLRVLPQAWLAGWPRTKFFAAVGVLAVAAVIVAWGHWNALHPKIIRLELALPRVPGAPEQVRVVVASDLHLGTLVTQARVRGWVETINALQPDLILLPGDVIDEDLPPVVENNLGEFLRDLRAPLGVYAVTGNHEYIGGVEAAVQYLEEHDVKVLRDRAIPLAGGAFWLAGREDASIGRFRGERRAPLREILQPIPPGVPIVVMDHQPIALAEAAAAGAALQVSGHTHDGQLWPNKYIVRALFGFSSGVGLVDRMTAYISPGLGTWGPPVRVGNRAEILDLILSFDGPAAEKF